VKCARSLKDGMEQRVAVAKALCMEYIDKNAKNVTEKALIRTLYSTLLQLEKEIKDYLTPQDLLKAIKETKKVIIFVRDVALWSCYIEEDSGFKMYSTVTEMYPYIDEIESLANKFIAIVGDRSNLKDVL